MQLKSFVQGRWHAGDGEAATLRDATTGEVIAYASAGGIDFGAVLEHARAVGGANLRRLTFHERAAMLKALAKQLGRKAKAVTLNAGALKAGWDYAEANLTKQDPFHIEAMNETSGKILIEGNAAAAIGCMMAGVTVVAWYPITPSSSLCESLIGYMKK